MIYVSSQQKNTMPDQLEELETLFAYRYTDADEDFTQTMSTPLASPPCVDNWYTRPKRQWDWTRGGRGGGRGRGGYDNRGRGGYNNRGGYHHQQRGNHHGDRYSDRNQYHQSRDHHGGNADGHYRERDQYRNRGHSYQHQRGGHYSGDRNQGGGHYGGERNRDGGSYERSGPSRTIYAGKKDDGESHYSDRHHPYGNRPQRGRGGPPHQ